MDVFARRFTENQTALRLGNRLRWNGGDLLPESRWRSGRSPPFWPNASAMTATLLSIATDFAARHRLYLHPRSPAPSVWDRSEGRACRHNTSCGRNKRGSPRRSAVAGSRRPAALRRQASCWCCPRHQALLRVKGINDLSDISAECDEPLNGGVTQQRKAIKSVTSASCGPPFTGQAVYLLAPLRLLRFPSLRWP